MIEYSFNNQGTGYDISLYGKPIGALFYGDARQAPQDRTFVTLLKADTGTRYHKSLDKAKDYVKTVYMGEIKCT